MEPFSSPVTAKPDAGTSWGKAASYYAGSFISLLKSERTGKKWNSLWKSKSGDRGMNHTGEVQSHAVPKQAFLVHFTTGARPGHSAKGGRATGRHTILTPVQCLSDTNQSGKLVSTSFQWKVVVLWFPPELWYSLGPQSCLLVQALSHKWSSMWGTVWNRIKAKLKIILKHNQEPDPRVLWSLGRQVVIGGGLAYVNLAPVRFLFLALGFMGVSRMTEDYSLLLNLSFLCFIQRY